MARPEIVPHEPAAITQASVAEAVDRLGRKGPCQTDLQAILRNRVSIGQLPKLLGVSRQSIWRWASQGYNGEKLRTFKIGHRRFTTERDLAVFIERLSGLDPNGPPTETVRQRDRRRQKQVQAARRFLDQEGV